MKRFLLFLSCVTAAVMFSSCSGNIDPEGEETGGDVSDTQNVPEGVLRIFADKTVITADGADEVTFTVMFGSEDVSNARTLQLVRIYDGTEKYMAYGVNKFSTTTAGTFLFKAEYYYAGKKYSDNTVEIVAEAYHSGQTREYSRNVLAAYFTSTGCTSCPSAYKGLKNLQDSNPGVISIVSFHGDMSMPDPMTTSETALFSAALQREGFPNVYFNLRKESRHIGPTFTGTFASEIAAYEPLCGVAIESAYDQSSRELDIKIGITSNLPSIYRYLVFLVEDNMDSKVLGAAYQQCGDDYVHHNVVRDVLATSAAGEKINDNLPLTPGIEATATKSLVLPEKWNAGNMRIVVSAMTSTDGGTTWVANNTNECKVGENVSYEFVE